VLKALAAQRKQKTASLKEEVKENTQDERKVNEKCSQGGSNQVGSGHSDCKDYNFTQVDEETIMDYVRKHRNTSRTSRRDLKEIIAILTKRCPKTWNKGLETRAWAMFKMTRELRKENLAKYLDPEKTVAGKDGSSRTRCTAKDFMTFPALWNLHTKEAGLELRELLRHFTINAPFHGRQFVRVWFEALVPCFSRWLLLSDSGNVLLVQTLKHFLGAFGQPGIVVCFPDKGSSILKILKDSARSVEALGRGKVERYYWKRLVESSCGGEEEWRQLAQIADQALEISQLDSLPPNWLSDTGDWVHVFANVVSPDITKHFEQYVRDTLSSSKLIKDVRSGPPKTLSRSMAKSQEYQSDYLAARASARWSQFDQNFRNQFKRPPNKVEDFVWNIVDFARCSIVVKSARDLLEMKKLVEERFQVVGLKNGYSSDKAAKGSGYRDLKLLVLVEFDAPQLRKLSQFDENIVMICEVQLICDKWLDNKKTTSLSYKVLRSVNLRNLLRDFAKYLEPTYKDKHNRSISGRDVIKNGWKNLVNYADFSAEDGNKLLLESATNGWDPAGVEVLITELKANPNCVGKWHKNDRTVANLAAIHNNHEILKTLIDLKASVCQNIFILYDTAFLNNEECVRLLLDAGCPFPEDDMDAMEYHYGQDPSYERVLNLLKGKEVPPFRPKSGKMTKMIRAQTVDDVVTAAVEGKLTDYLDNHDVRLSVISGALLSSVISAQLELCLQVLWFGADVNFKSKGWTPLCSAISFSTLEVVELLLRMKANTEIMIPESVIPAVTRRPMKDIVLALLKQSRDVPRMLQMWDTEYTVFHLAFRCDTEHKYSQYGITVLAKM